MQKIASFEVDHLKLKRGLYLSRLDKVGEEFISSFDIRIKVPNKEPVINIAEIHTLEHLGATFLRNHEKEKDNILYFGPMGCRTGMYLVIAGKRDSKSIYPLIKEMFEFINDFDEKEKIPGASAIECGNWLDHNLPAAKWESKKYYLEVLKDIKEENLIYPNKFIIKNLEFFLLFLLY